jgi:hypothetical protein
VAVERSPPHPQNLVLQVVTFIAVCNVIKWVARHYYGYYDRNDNGEHRTQALSKSQFGPSHVIYQYVPPGGKDVAWLDGDTVLNGTDRWAVE